MCKNDSQCGTWLARIPTQAQLFLAFHYYSKNLLIQIFHKYFCVHFCDQKPLYARYVVDTTPACVCKVCTYGNMVFPSRSHLVGWLARNSKAHREIYRFSVLKYTFAYLMGFFVACQITTVGYCLDVDGIFMIYQSYLTAIKVCYAR